MPRPKTDVMRGTLDLMVLKTLAATGPLHGYGIARRIEQLSDNALALNQGTLHPALTRLARRRCISSSWGASDNNRRARFYRITRAGEKQLAQQTRHWNRIAAVMGRLLGQR